MLLFQKIKECFFGIPPVAPEKEAPEAYDLWSATYDRQPDNLMLYLDGQLFTRLLDKIDLEGKTVLDIGCGTGRHWQEMLDRQPAGLNGCDVSEGMLTELKKKFPGADVHLTTDNLLSGVPGGSIDVIVSTLTIAHVKDVEELMRSWNRVLKQMGYILVTDFHPGVLAGGGKRDFVSGKKRVVIKNYVHPLHEIKRLAGMHNMQVAYEEEMRIDETVKHFYEKQQALHIYERFKGQPIIYGILLTKS